MSRWGKNIVVPLDSLCKEKENTNRPTVARSVGTVGKWGKMGFTSTRTYALSSLPAAVAAAAAAASLSPASALDDDMSLSVPEPPKPKKFFKSRNAAPPEVIAQIIQHLPRTPTSPTREVGASGPPGYLTTPVYGRREPIKLKIPKSNSAERKKKSPKKPVKSIKTPAPQDDAGEEETAPSSLKTAIEPKIKKKKDEKKLKPEAPPSRVIARARKAVNYCEDEEEERLPTPVKNIVVPKSTNADLDVGEESEIRDSPAPHELETAMPSALRAELPPPAAPPLTTVIAMSPAASVSVTPPEHPPIVLRISKGTSRLVSTDSEEQANNASASPQTHDNSESTKSRHASTEEVPATTTVHPTTPKIIVKPPKPPSPAEALLQSNNENNDDEPPEINYCTVKISPDKPPKERLKLIIKTDVIRNAIAAAAAAAAAKAAAAAEKAALSESMANVPGSAEFEQRPEREKKQKSKKHKHPKHPALEQLTPATAAAVEFKTPSPHLALGNIGEHHQHQRAMISPPALSERDFDSQSSVLGSISSKGNSTPQLNAQVAQEESCVIHSRGSSVITSDLETSQHSSLVAPPSDIESRLESMMMDGGEVSQRAATALVADEEPLQDILAVLRGDESQSATIKENGIITKEDNEKKQDTELANEESTMTKRRVTRGRGKGVSKTNCVEEDVEEKRPTSPNIKAPTAAKTRGRKLTAFSPQQAEEAPVKRSTRRGAKKADEGLPMEIDEVPNSKANTVVPTKSSTKQTDEIENENAHTEQAALSTVTRRGRTTRNASNNNNNLSSSNNNNNINKIAANLSARAGAAEEAKVVITTTTKTTPTTTSPIATIQVPARSYGRKRKNQQVMQVLQPSAADLDEHQQPPPAKVANIDLDVSAVETTTTQTPPPPSSVQQQDSETAQAFDLHDANSDSNSLTRPASTTPTSPRRDYKIKDKFKRTLTLDNQVNCNAVIAAPPTGGEENVNTQQQGEEEQQRGAVKLVISKKKGSIFKSRALVPADQFEQAGTTTKRHLYKHRWDADANGGSGGSGGGTTSDSNAKLANDSPATANTRNAADAIFDDFSEDLSGGGDSHSRDHSPALGKLNRVVKPNLQSTGSDSGDAADTPTTLISGCGGTDLITSVKVDRKAKEYYTVVRNVKTAHQIQEIGEYQEMDDDVEYFLDALQPHNPTATRCLSALQLATKCMTAAFRMHVRAHGVVTKFFKALADANTDLSLGLCTSVIMFILSQEGLNMDLDRDSLELMMNLLEAEEGVAAPADRANYDRNWHKVRNLCEEIKVQGKATHLNVDAITVGTLAMETLLSLTSKRAGDWFKEELRALGGLEHIIKTISACCQPVFDCGGNESGGVSWTPALLDNLQTVARCMRVLENVTQMNEENQRYMLTYAQGAAVESICKLYRLCDRELMQHATTGESSAVIVLRELLIPVMKVLINLTHTFNASIPESRSNGAELLGQRADVLQTSLNLLLQATNYIPDRSIFELSILVLLLLINLTMYAKANRKLIMHADAPPEFGTQASESSRIPAVQAIMAYFYKCEELARLVEKNTDAILDNTDKNKKKQEEVDETVNNLLQKAGHHMEHTLKGSYAGLLIGHLISDSPEYETVVRTHLRDNGFKEIVSVLEKYHTFMNLTASSESSVVAHIKSTKQLIDYFKRRDYELNETSTNDGALPLNLETHHTQSTHIDDATPAPSTRSTQRVYKTYSQR